MDLRRLQLELESRERMENLNRFKQNSRWGTRRDASAQPLTGVRLDAVLAVVWNVLRNFPEARQALELELNGHVANVETTATSTTTTN